MQKGVSKQEVLLQGKLSSLAKKDMHWANKLFSRPSMHNLISFYNSLHIASCHPDLVKSILRDETTRSLLTAEDLVALTSSNANVALTILNDQALVTKLHANALAQLALISPSVANFIFESEGLFAKLDSRAIAHIGASCPNLATQLYEDEALFNLINPQDYGIFCKTNLTLANELLNSGVPNEMTGSDLSEFGRYHSEIAVSILTTPQLYQKLSNDDFYHMLEHHADHAVIAFKDPNIMSQLGPSGWAQLARQHKGFAKDLMDSKKYMAQLDGQAIATMCHKRPKLAHFYYSQMQHSDYFHQLLHEQLATLGEISAKVAHAMLNDPKVKTALTGQDLMMIGRTHTDVAKKILDDKKLISKMDGVEIANLCLAGPDILNRVFKDKKLLEKIVSSQMMGMLSAQYLSVLNQVSTQESLQKGMPEDTLADIQRQSSLFNRVATLTDRLQSHKSLNGDQVDLAYDSGSHALTPLFSRKSHPDQRKEDVEPQPVKRKVILH